MVSQAFGQGVRLSAEYEYRGGNRTSIMNRSTDLSDSHTGRQDGPGPSVSFSLSLVDCASTLPQSMQPPQVALTFLPCRRHRSG